MYQFQRLICRALTSITSINWVPAKYKEKIRRLYFLADLENMTEFEKFIKEELEGKPNQISRIAILLYKDEYFRENLGKKLFVLVLKYTLAGVIICEGQHHHYYLRGSCDCLSKQQELNNIFADYNFQSSSLDQLILCCSQKLGYQESQFHCQIDESDLKQEDINAIFKEQKTDQYYQHAFLKQTIRNLQQNYYNYAKRSIEKILTKQIIIAFIQKNFDLIANSTLKIQPQFLDAQLDLQSLRKILFESQSIFPKDEQAINTIFQKIKEQKDLSYDYLIALKKKIFPIDSFQIERLIQKNEQVAEMITGKDGIFLIGSTKSGKTTSCLKMLGVNFDKSQNQELVPRTKLKNSQYQFLTTPIQPCTKSFTAAFLPAEIYGEQFDGYCLIDTPGFGDSLQSNMVMRNSLPKLISTLKTVRMGLIISQSDLKGNKQEIIKMAQNLSNLFYSREQISNINIYFNQIPRENIELIPEYIQNAQNIVRQRQTYNDKILTFFDLLKQRSLQLSSYLYPLENDYKAVVKEIIQKLPINKLNSKFYVDQKSSTKLQIKDGLNSSLMRFRYYKTNIWLDQMKMEKKNVEKLQQIIHDEQQSNQLFEGFRKLQQILKGSIKLQQFLQKYNKIEEKVKQQRKIKSFLKKLKKQNIVNIHFPFLINLNITPTRTIYLQQFFHPNIPQPITYFSLSQFIKKFELDWQASIPRYHYKDYQQSLQKRYSQFSSAFQIQLKNLFEQKSSIKDQKHKLLSMVQMRESQLKNRLSDYSQNIFKKEIFQNDEDFKQRHTYDLFFLLKGKEMIKKIKLILRIIDKIQTINRSIKYHKNKYCQKIIINSITNLKNYGYYENQHGECLKLFLGDIDLDQKILHVNNFQALLNQLQYKLLIYQSIQIVFEQIAVGNKHLTEIYNFKERIRQKRKKMSYSRIKNSYHQMKIENACYQLYNQILQMKKQSIINKQLKWRQNNKNKNLQNNQLFKVKMLNLQKQSKEQLDKIKSLHQRQMNELFNKSQLIDQKQDLILEALKMLKLKKSRYFNKQVVEEIQKKYTTFIQNKLKNSKKQCTMKMKKIKNEFIKNSKKIKSIQTDGQKYQRKIKQESKEKLYIFTQLIGQTYNDKILMEPTLENAVNLQVERNNMLIGAQNQIKIIQREKIDKNNTKINQQISEIKKSFNQILQDFIQSLTNYQKTIFDTRYQVKKHFKFLDSILQYFSKEKELVQIIAQSLLNHKSLHRVQAITILKTHKIFKKYVQSYEQNQTVKVNIDHIIQKICIKSANGSKHIQNEQNVMVSQAYHKYQHFYDKYINSYEKHREEQYIDQIITICKDIAEKLKHQRQLVERQQKIKLLAGICAIYSIKNSQIIEQKVKWMIQPDESSILLAMSLLGILNEKQKLKNDLVQINTARQKGFVSAIVSVYQALSGFNINYANESAHLCQKFKQDYEQLFLMFSVESKMRYGAFKEICQKIISKKNETLQQQIVKFLFEKSIQIQKNKELSQFSIYFPHKKGNENYQLPSLLLIDEPLNIFMSNQLNQMYSPTIKLKDKKITQFLYFVWQKVSEKGEAVQLQEIIESTYFKDMIEKFSTIKDLLYNQVSEIIAGALYYQHKYFLIDNQIKYEKDGDNDDISFGYKTMFANIYEYQQENISSSHLNKVLCIELKVAQLSYAHIPIFFDNILATTSNYDEIPLKQKKNMAELFKFQNCFSVLPKETNLSRIIENYFIVSENNMRSKIISKIQQNQDRPCIIFFKTKEQLDELFDSQQYKPYRMRSSIISQRIDPFIRDSLLIRSTFGNSITLMTSNFGRDLQFDILDRQIEQKGGISIIQTFLATDQFQQNRIKSKTIKKDYPGNYYCIISQNELPIYGLKFDENMQEANSDIIYNILSQAKGNINNKCSLNWQNLEELKKKHQNTRQLYQNEISQKKLIQYIQSINQDTKINKKKIKIILAIDHLGFTSDSTINQLKQNVGQIFSAVQERAQNQKLQITLNMKLILNHNCLTSDMISQTPFQNDPNRLKKFLQKIKIKRGLIYQSDQCFLARLSQQKSVDKIILITDSNSKVLQGLIRPYERQSQQYQRIRSEAEERMKSLRTTLMDKIGIIFIKSHENSEIYKYDLNEIKEQPSTLTIISRNASQNLQKQIIGPILTTISQICEVPKLKLIERN